MNDTHKGVLDRELSVESARQFKEKLDLLNELVDYGTFLLPRAFGSSPRDVKAVCVIFVQLRQFLVHLDAVSLLAAAGNCSSGTLQLRSLLEAAHTMEWLLKSDSETKVSYLYVANLRERKRWQSIAVPGSAEATKHVAMAGRLPFDGDQITAIAEEISRIDSLLNQPPLATINARFEQFYVKHGYDQPWYKAYGVQSIRKIGGDIGRLNEYTYIYSPSSGVTHGSDMWKSLVFGNRELHVNPVREPQNIPTLLKLPISLALRVYRFVLSEYRSGELENFARKYLQEWRIHVEKEYAVQVVPQTIII